MVEGVGCLQDDGREQPVEEQVRAVLREQRRLRVVNDGAEGDAHQHQKAEDNAE